VGDQVEPSLPTGRRATGFARVAASVIVVNYRTPDLTERAIRSAIAEGVEQVVVIDNASGDGSLGLLRGIDDPRVIVVESPNNLGFGAAANLGAGRASGDLLVFLNSDAEFEPGAMGPIVDELTRQGHSVVGPRVLNIDRSIQRSAGMLPRPLDLTIRAVGLHHLAQMLSRMPVLGSVMARTTLAREYSASTWTSRIDVSMVSGSCLGIRTADFRALGGFDDRYFMYFEDADLCRRAAQSGMLIRFVPDARVTHRVAGSAENDWHFGPLHGPSMVVYLRRWNGRLGGSMALWLLAVRAIAKTVLRRPGASRASAAFRLGVAAYREGRSRDPSPSSVPTPYPR
jgi:GT2 family glycosyltransferase